MAKFQPVIKWSGSKRSQAEEILKRFPKKIDTYYEPFCGGASMLRALLESDIEVNRYICSDVCKPLIELWNLIKDKPKELCDAYEIHHSLFKNERGDYFYKIRDEFNKYQSPYDFLFLLRTCANGMPRFNKKGEFNTPVHHGRDGIIPHTFRNICYEWSELLNRHNVEFICQSYECIKTNIGDFVYLDPPYANTKGMYYGLIDYDALWEWMRNQKGNYIMSFDGVSGKSDLTYDVPPDLFVKHEYILSGNSSFKRITHTSNNDIVYESLYLKL